tara:strand:+ start:1123 stop:1344 length:222 start_codon:yes stop_codon:yes gene_type:complete
MSERISDWGDLLQEMTPFIRSSQGKKPELYLISSNGQIILKQYRARPGLWFQAPQEEQEWIRQQAIFIARFGT